MSWRLEYELATDRALCALQADSDRAKPLPLTTAEVEALERVARAALQCERAKWRDLPSVPTRLYALTTALAGLPDTLRERLLNEGEREE